jgi:subtilisin family serine protease
MLLDPEVMRFLPSDAPRVIGVGATGPNGSASDPTTSPYRYSFSNQGIQLISFVAPGGYRYQKPPLRLVGRACASNTDCSDPDYAATCETNPANGRKSCQIACTSDDTCLGPNRSFSGLACSAITQAVLGKSTCQVTICPMGGTSAHFRCFALDQPFSLQPTEQRLKPTLFSGTSAAAPVLAGFLALLKQKYPTLTPDQLVKKLKDASIDLGDKGRDPVFGYGHPDAARISW